LQRVEALEKGASFDATKKEVDRVRMECLEQLRTIRKAVSESKGDAASAKELEALRAENATLQRLTKKQTYRIQHLVTTVDDLLEKKN
jgi:alpha-L-arabinofuranosidase